MINRKKFLKEAADYMKHYHPEYIERNPDIFLDEINWAADSGYCEAVASLAHGYPESNARESGLSVIPTYIDGIVYEDERERLIFPIAFWEDGLIKDPEDRKHLKG
jgi:hypothetical protein